MKNKIWIIIRREYLTRVRNRSFILSTLLLPVVLILFFGGSIYLSLQSQKEDQKIAVVDHSGLFKTVVKNGGNITYDFNEGVTPDNFAEKGYSAYLYIPSDYSIPGDSVRLISSKQISVVTQEEIRDAINEAIRNKTLLDNHIDRKLLDSINNIKPRGLYNFVSVVKQGDETKHSNPLLSYGIGFGSGILIYMTLLIYGAAVMRGVMEEKTNRIAEIIVSSVRPFQLMAGKIIGIAAVGLTQLLIWIVFGFLILIVGSMFISPEAISNPDTLQSALASGQAASPMASEILSAKTTLLSAPWGLIIPCFIFYFLSGYLFYASLFAGVGSVVNEDPQDAQALMLPITMPIILSFVLMTAVISNPDSSLAVWGSIIPFSSPIIMMARIPSGNVLPWELILSMVLVAGGFVFTTYIAAKIYRTGILLYGKKVTLRELGKWLVRKS